MDTISTRHSLRDYDYSSVKESEKENSGRSLGKKSLWARLWETWIFEISGFVVGFLCLAATVYLLHFHNNKTVPDWPITLNFALSVVNNLGFAVTLFGVHSAVAQYKWILFSESPRPLSQLGIFQRVRSSPLNAFELVYELGSHFIIITGGVAIVLGMFWGPFTQNLIRYETGPMIVPDDVALLARSVYYRARGLAIGGGSYEADPMLQLNMLNAIATAPNNPEVHLPDYVCPTGNCTWPVAATLAFCSECTDLTAQIVLDCRERMIYNGLSQSCIARIPSSGCSLWSESDFSTDEALMNITQLNVSYKSTLIYHSIRRVTGATVGSVPIKKRETDTVKGRPYVTRNDFSATECWLRPCVRSFQASVSDGKYAERVMDTFMNDLDQDWSTILQPPWGKERGIYTDQEGNNVNTFSMGPPLDPNHSSGVSRDSYDRLFNSFVGSVQTRDGHSGIDLSGTSTVNAMLSAIFDNNFDPVTCGSPNNDTFACVMDALAQSISKTIRNSGMNSQGRAAASEENAVRGTVYTTATFVRVQWYWINLPAAVWALGLLTWAVIALRSSRMGLPTWRDDLLPLVFLYNRGLRLNEEGVMTHDSIPEKHSAVGGPLHRSMSHSGHPEYDRLLRAEKQSSWAYESVADRITVQLRDGNEGIAGRGSPPAGVIRLEPVKE